MKAILEKFLKVDRRVIFLLVGVIIAIPIIWPFNLPVTTPTEAVLGVYNEVEALPHGSPLLLSFDYDPASKPELSPMAIAICRHAFKKNLRIIAMNLWVTATGMADDVLTQTAKEYGKEYGRDYTFLGWQPMSVAVITGMGTDIYSVYSKDQKGNDTRSQPVMKGIRTLKDFPYMVELGAGYPGLPEWLAYGTDKFGVKIGAGCTAVSEPGLRTYLQSNQVTGLMGSMKSAAEYESLINKPGLARAGMDAISMAHFLLLFLVLLANAIVLIIKFS